MCTLVYLYKRRQFALNSVQKRTDIQITNQMFPWDAFVLSWFLLYLNNSQTLLAEDLLESPWLVLIHEWTLSTPNVSYSSSL